MPSWADCARAADEADRRAARRALDSLERNASLRPGCGGPARRPGIISGKFQMKFEVVDVRAV